MEDQYDAPVYQPQQPKPVRHGRAWDPRDWIFDDCVAKVCLSGYIIVQEYSGYESAYLCPKCSRGEAKWIPVYKGVLDLYTKEEMEKRRQEKLNIVADAEERKKTKGALVEGMRTLG